MHTSAASLLAFAASVQAVYKGFNYASTNGDKSPRTAADFTEYFKTAQKLVGTSGFSSARLYTMIVSHLLCRQFTHTHFQTHADTDRPTASWHDRRPHLGH